MKLAIEIIKNSPSQSFNLIVFLKDTVLPLITSFLTMFGLWQGMRFIHSFRDKQKNAVYGFWSQYSYRIRRIHDELYRNHGLLNNLYDNNRRRPYTHDIPSNDTISLFKNMILELDTILKTTPDQMPAYEGWSEDLHKIISFISCVCTYDICNKDDLFVNSVFPDRDIYCDDICDTLRKMARKIEKAQTKIETKMYRPYTRLLDTVSRSTEKKIPCQYTGNFCSGGSNHFYVTARKKTGKLTFINTKGMLDPVGNREISIVDYGSYDIIISDVATNEKQSKQTITHCAKSSITFPTIKKHTYKIEVYSWEPQRIAQEYIQKKYFTLPENITIGQPGKTSWIKLPSITAKKTISCSLSRHILL